MQRKDSLSSLLYTKAESSMSVFLDIVWKVFWLFSDGEFTASPSKSSASLFSLLESFLLSV